LACCCSWRAWQLRRGEQWTHRPRWHKPRLP